MGLPRQRTQDGPRIVRRFTLARSTRRPGKHALDDPRSKRGAQGLRDIRRAILVKLLPEADVGQSGLLHFMAAGAPGQLAKYALKGIEAKYERYFPIEAVDQGFIPGRGRTAVSLL